MADQRKRVTELLEKTNEFYRRWKLSDGVQILAERETAGRLELMVGMFSVVATPGGLGRLEPRWALSLQEAMIGGVSVELARLVRLKVGIREVLGEPEDERPSPISWEPEDGKGVLFVSPDATAVRLVAFP